MTVISDGNSDAGKNLGAIKGKFLKGKPVKISRKKPELTKEILVYLFEIPVESIKDSFELSELKKIDVDDIVKKLEKLGGASYQHFQTIIIAYQKMLARRDTTLETFFKDLQNEGALPRSLLEKLDFEYHQRGKAGFIFFLVKELILSALYLVGQILKILTKALILPVKIALRELFCIVAVVVVLLVAMVKFIMGPKKFITGKETNLQKIFFLRSRFKFTKHELKYSLQLLLRAAFINGGNIRKAKSRLSKTAKGVDKDVWKDAGLLPFAAHMQNLQTMFLGR